MEMRAGGGSLGRAARERLDWLAGLCLLAWPEEQILGLLLGLDDGEPAQRWWSPPALAERLALGARNRPDLGARKRPDLGARERPDLGARKRPDLGARERPDHDA